MNRDRAKEFYPFLQAFAEGKVIECRTKPNAINGHIPNDWTELREIEYWGNVEYRIKPEPKYRLFTNSEDCWQEMQNHQPFGWIKRNGYRYNIISISDTSVKIIDTRGAISTLYFSDLFMRKDYRFIDGTPFGIREEK